MDREPFYEETHMVGGRRARRPLRWLLALGAVVLAAIAIALVIPNQDRRGVASRGADGPGAQFGAVGTSGEGDADAGGPGEGALGTVITEIGTITGANDATGLIGRRVDLHVDVQEIASDVAFWAGEGDNRLLVVFGRDTRDGFARQTGRPSDHDVDLKRGEQATISGVIRPVPYAEATDSWRLTRRDITELAERGVYVRADTVSANGHQ